MACQSPDVVTATQNSLTAKEQIDKLQKAIKAQSEQTKKNFFEEIDKALFEAKIGDARQLAYTSDIKTEYTSEFSLDKISNVVVAALETIAKTKDPKIKAPPMGEEAVKSYVNLVNTVAEAAKSGSESSSSLTFSYNRLMPGLLVFLYAESMSVKDEVLFGKEAVTTTAIYYRLMQSNDDIENDTAYGLALIESESIMNTKTLQAGLIEDYTQGTITFDEWMKKDAQLGEALKMMITRLGNTKFKEINALKARGVEFHDEEVAMDNHLMVISQLTDLDKHDPDDKKVINVIKERVEDKYFIEPVFAE